jgi:hypothetical protein
MLQVSVPNAAKWLGNFEGYQVYSALKAIMTGFCSFASS